MKTREKGFRRACLTGKFVSLNVLFSMKLEIKGKFCSVIFV